MSDKDLVEVDKLLPSLGLGEEEMKEIAGLAQEEMDGYDLRGSLPTIKIGHTVGRFEIPGIDDAPKSFTGIVVFQHRTNAYFLSESHPEYDVDDNRPVCVSNDSYTGSATSASMLDDVMYSQISTDLFGGLTRMYGDCNKCVLNQFGSAYDNSGNLAKGKACKNSARLYIMRKGQTIPSVLMIPPSSLRIWSQYLTETLSATNDLGLIAVVTKFELNIIEHGQQKYSELSFSCEQRLLEDKKGQELFAKMIRWRTMYKSSLKDRQVVQDIVVPEAKVADDDSDMPEAFQ